MKWEKCNRILRHLDEGIIRRRKYRQRVPYSSSFVFVHALSHMSSTCWQHFPCSAALIFYISNWNLWRIFLGKCWIFFFIISLLSSPHTPNSIDFANNAKYKFNYSYSCWFYRNLLSSSRYVLLWTFCNNNYSTVVHVLVTIIIRWIVLNLCAHKRTNNTNTKRNYVRRRANNEMAQRFRKHLSSMFCLWNCGMERVDGNCECNAMLGIQTEISLDGQRTFFNPFAQRTLSLAISHSRQFDSDTQFYLHVPRPMSTSSTCAEITRFASDVPPECSGERDQPVIRHLHEQKWKSSRDSVSVWNELKQNKKRRNGSGSVIMLPLAGIIGVLSVPYPGSSLLFNTLGHLSSQSSGKYIFDALKAFNKFYFNFLSALPHPPPCFSLRSNAFSRLTS